MNQQGKKVSSRYAVLLYDEYDGGEVGEQSAMPQYHAGLSVAHPLSTIHLMRHHQNNKR